MQLVLMCPLNDTASKNYEKHLPEYSALKLQNKTIQDKQEHIQLTTTQTQ